MDAAAVAAVTVVLVTLTSGLTLFYASTARLAGGLLTATGVTAGIGLWLINAAEDAGTSILLFSALVLFPSCLWAYPAPVWRHPVDHLLAALLIGPGLIALVDRNAALMMGIIAFLALVAQTWWRLERSHGDQRRALSWLALTGSVSSLIGLAVGFTSPQASPPVSIGMLAVIPIGLVIGVLRPNSIDVQGLAVSATVAVTLVIGYVSYFVGTLAVLELLGIRQPSALAVATIGLAGGFLLRPSAGAMRGVMDRLLFGERPDPLVAASEVVGTIGENPSEALDTVRSALMLPYAQLQRGDEVIARSGTPVAHTREISSTADHITLRVGLRPGDLTLTSSDAAVLHLVTPLLVQLVRATELSAAVQQLRTDEIKAVAEERRRLRAELHDDLGPTLTGIAYSTEAARNLIPRDPGAAGELLGRVRTDIAAAITQIRQIVYGMRPPALAELGLVEAVRQHSSAGLDVHVQVDEPLPTISAAPEVAAYRVITEALTNAARHSHATAATVTLGRQGDDLVIAVTDDGANGQPWRAGVGMTSMQDRIHELGGSFWAGPTASGGVVRAVLPDVYTKLPSGPLTSE